MTQDIRFLCAGGFRAAMDALSPLFEKAHGVTISTTYATPARTREFLEAGFPFDAGVIVASVLEKAQRDGLATDAPSFKLAICPVGLGVALDRPAPDISSLDTFRRALGDIGRLGLSDPAAGTNLGAETLAHADRLGFGELMRAKVVLFNGPGSAVSAAVARGEADAVITLASEIAPINGVRYVGRLPDELQTEYAMQALAPATMSEPARRLLEFLRGEPAKEIMRNAGLDPVV